LAETCIIELVVDNNGNFASVNVIHRAGCLLEYNKFAISKNEKKEEKKSSSAKDDSGENDGMYSVFDPDLMLTGVADMLGNVMAACCLRPYSVNYQKDLGKKIKLSVAIYDDVLKEFCFSSMHRDFEWRHKQYNS
jgi:hypothetical protein